MLRRSPPTESWSSRPRPGPAPPPAPEAGRKRRRRRRFPESAGGHAPARALAPGTGLHAQSPRLLRNTGGTEPRPRAGGLPVTAPAARTGQRGGRTETTETGSIGVVPGVTAGAGGSPGPAQGVLAVLPVSAMRVGDGRGGIRGPGLVAGTVHHRAVWRGTGDTNIGRGAGNGWTRRRV